jgi:hypothetical protein
VQNVWCNTPVFGDLNNETDPIISPRNLPEGFRCNNFTVPNIPIRNRYTGVSQFVTIKGGAYFFLPSLKTLDYFLT